MQSLVLTYSALYRQTYKVNTLIRNILMSVSVAMVIQSDTSLVNSSIDGTNIERNFRVYRVVYIDVCNTYIPYTDWWISMICIGYLWK